MPKSNFDVIYAWSTIYSLGSQFGLQSLCLLQSKMLQFNEKYL